LDVGYLKALLPIFWFISGCRISTVFEEMFVQGAAKKKLFGKTGIFSK